MRYYKVISGNYLEGIGTGDGIGIDITEIEYNTIFSIIENKPEDTETHYYALRADTLEYEAIERPEPIPMPEQKYTLNEAATILAQEVNA